MIPREPWQASQDVNIPGSSSTGGHFPDIPKFYALIFAIWNEVTTISFAVNECNTFYVPHQDSCWLRYSVKATSIPHLDKRIPYMICCMNIIPNALTITSSTILLFLQLWGKCSLTSYKRWLLWNTHNIYRCHDVCRGETQNYKCYNGKLPYTEYHHSQNR